MNLVERMETAPAATFDYAALPAEMVPRQQDRAARIRGMYRQTVETAGEIGRELLAAQAEMDHGQFLPGVPERGAGCAGALLKRARVFYLGIGAAIGKRPHLCDL